MVFVQCRYYRHLRTLVLWWGADDPMLSIVGSVCRRLESADFWRSAAVTDLGVKMLLLSDDDTSERGDGRSPLCSTLKRLGLKETSCTHVGCLAAAVACPGLEVLTFSHTAVVKVSFVSYCGFSLQNWCFLNRTFSPACAT